jgi:hypothetical protein
MIINLSNQMQDEIRTAAQKILSGELAKLTLPSNGAIELSIEDNGGEKIEVQGKTIYVFCKDLLGNTPLSERKMIGK